VSSYARHAQRFGVDCVYETAVREWLPRVPGPVDLTWCSPAERERVFREREAAAAERDVALAELMLLRLELDAIEAVRKNGRYTVGKRRRRSPEETGFWSSCCAVRGSSTGRSRLGSGSATSGCGS
jgi:hypothetical protein